MKPEATTAASSQPAAGGREYEPPRVEVLGTVSEVTMGAPGLPGPDFSTIGSVSDRRLKHHREQVAVAEVLERLVALPRRPRR